jgi:hypothetical protein
MKTIYHRNGEVTVWDVFKQGWVRCHAARVPKSSLLGLMPEERERLIRHGKKNPIKENEND